MTLGPLGASLTSVTTRRTRFNVYTNRACKQVCNQQHNVAMSKALILRVFSSYNLILTSQGRQWLTSLLEHFSDEDPEEILSHMAAALQEESGPINVPELERTYERLQVSGGTTTHPSGQDAEGEEDDLPDQLIKVVDAFSMPRVQWNASKATLEKSSTAPSLLGAPDSKATYLRDRYSIIKQTILRSDHFSPPALPGHDRSDYLRLTLIKNLLGRQGQRFLLFGMLTRTQDGRFALEDLDDMVPLDLSQANSAVGLFVEGCFVLVDGIYESNATFTATEIAHPPSEGRKIARSIFGHLDHLGIGSLSLAEEASFQKLELLHPNSIVVISDLYLDQIKVRNAFRSILAGYESVLQDDQVQPASIPVAFVLCGNFSSKAFIMDGKSTAAYTNGLDALGDIIQQFPVIAEHSTFILVPGPGDPFDSSTLPRPSLPLSLAKPLLSRFPKGNLILASNPCRFMFLGQEIVVYRQDLMSKLLRNTIMSKSASARQAEESGRAPDSESTILQEYLVQTVLDQAHLSPLSVNIQPVLWEYDHALRLYPMPTTLILADHSSPSYDLTYELGDGGKDGKCHVFNPGSFVGNRYSWRTYHTDTRVSEQSELPD